MCGLVGILGSNEVAPKLLNALQRLEYRGYDSAGIATVDSSGQLKRRRAVGKIVNLYDLLVNEPLTGQSGIGHTRWATHGAPTLENAHPQRAGPVAVVHNGVIENFKKIRESLEGDGYHRQSETDTEVIALNVQRLIEKGASPAEAVKETIGQLEGAFALAFLFEGEKDLLLAARKGSPLAIGLGKGEMFVGSDAIALAPLTDNIVYLEEGDFASITRAGHVIEDISGEPVDRPVSKIMVDALDEEVEQYRLEGSGGSQATRFFDVESVKNIASNNSTSIYLSLIVLEEHIGLFIERVRGSNSLDPDLKDRYLSFLVQHQQNISALANSLPDAGEELEIDKAELTATYLDKYWVHLKDNTEEYLAPERTAGLTVPLGIVALSTGIGTLFGQPIAGTILGAWLAGKVSPEKVVGKLWGDQKEPPQSQ